LYFEGSTSKPQITLLLVINPKIIHSFSNHLVINYEKRSERFREYVRNLDMRVQVHPGELWVSKQRVHIVLVGSKSAGAKGDVPKICGFVHPLHPL
jgi:hypothetical protein